MSDNTAITAGSGTTIATDVVGGAHHQRVKLSWGVDGVAVDASETDPLPVGGTLALSTGESHLGEMGYAGQVIKVIPTISTSAYTAGDVVGGKITFTNALRLTSGSARLKSLTLVDEDNEKSAFTLLLFDSDYTLVADNVTWTWNTADHAKLVAAISVRGGDISADGDWVTVGGDAVATIPLADILVVGSGVASLYGALITHSTPTFGTTSDLHLHLGLERN
jgi:hypothetical protein